MKRRDFLRSTVVAAGALAVLPVVAKTHGAIVIDDPQRRNGLFIDPSGIRGYDNGEQFLEYSFYDGSLTLSGSMSAGSIIA